MNGTHSTPNPAPTTRPRVVLVVSSLQCGGGERSCLTLAERFQRDGHETCLITGDEKGAQTFLKPALNLLTIPLGFSSCSISRPVELFQRTLELRSTIAAFKPDVVIAFLDATYTLTLLACIDKAFPIIISERIAPRYAPITRFVKLVRRLLYWKASGVVVVSPDILPDLRLTSRQSAKFIPGPIEFSPEVEVKRRRDRIILAMGRLVPQKGFDLLISAFSRIAALDAARGWRLVIHGHGDRKAELDNQIRELGLQDAVRILSPIEEPHDMMRSVEIFVLSSRFEGYPRVLAEALMAGCACVSFDCPGAPRYMIKNEWNGLLVPNGDVDALGHAMLRLMGSSELREQLGCHGDFIAKQSLVDATFSQWAEFVSSIHESKKVRR